MKTAIVRQLAQESNSNFIFLSLSHITDPAELCGWPVKEHLVNKNEEYKWITGELIDEYIKLGYIVTDQTRMGYAIPSWVQGLDTNKSTICVLDDYTRANPQVLQAAMTITYEQEYISWKLPKNTTVILTTNPDDSLYNVSSIDDAQSSRFISFNVKFSKNDWAEYAERRGIDGRAISFMLLYGDELFDKKENKYNKINARSYTMFANSISGIRDWSTSDGLSLILQISSGCFSDESDSVGNLFTTFIANKLDKLISPKDMLFESWDTVKTKIHNCVYDGGQYRPDIASVLSTRLLNYSLLYFGEKRARTEVVQDRLLDFINHDEMLLAEDLLFHLIKTITTQFSSRANKLIMNPKIRAKIL